MNCPVKQRIVSGYYIVKNDNIYASTMLYFCQKIFVNNISTLIWLEITDIPLGRL